jgi:hypothetical protein
MWAFLITELLEVYESLDGLSSAKKCRNLGSESQKRMEISRHADVPEYCRNPIRQNTRETAPRNAASTIAPIRV